MATFKVVISDPKTKKAYQKEVDQGPSGLVNKKIGETFSGDALGLTGYELQVTGGSDRDGFPMRRDVAGAARKKILLAFGPGFHPRLKGQRKRKSIRGNTVSPDIAQINAKVAKYGAKPIEELLGVKKEEEPKAEAAQKEQAGPAAEKKEKKPKKTAGSAEKEKKEEPAAADEKPEAQEPHPEEKASE